MKIGIKKLIASAALSAALVFGAAGTASAFYASLGDFVIGIVGPNEEYALQIPGKIDFSDADGKFEIPVGRYDNLWDFDNIGGTFTGGTTLSDLRVLGYAQVASIYPTAEYYAYYAVQKGETPDFSQPSFQSFSAQTMNINMYHKTGQDDPPSASFKPSNDSQTVDWEMGDVGRYGTLLYNEIGQELLTDLDVGSPVELEVWMTGDDYYGRGGWPYFQKTDYLVRVGVDADTRMVYAETAAVPVPAALWLLGSGFLAMMGMRRRNNG